ncbi:MAG: hypothetical protein JWO30_2277 [Fibrobacteres bacterium]|nr:hypothetical protein [Fibrobacterota bacterium]
MRYGKLAAVLLVAGAWLPVRALVHSVSDFRQDSSAAAGDKFRLDGGWGDSLMLDAQFFRYTTAKTVRLSDGHFNNGGSGAGPIVSNIGLFRFKVAYVAWNGTTHDATNGPNNLEAPRANIVTRTIDLSPDTAATDDAAVIIASQENVTEIPPKIFYLSGPPAPTYMNFATDGNQFAAYWGSATPSGPIRRTTSRDPQIGTYVIPASPVIMGELGRMSSCLIPGSGGTKTMVAYETNFSPGKFEVRWEDITAGTSVVSVTYVRPVLPADFAVAADSSGNSVVLWREDADLYGVAFNAAHVEIMAPILLQSNVVFQEDSVPTIQHFYRPYSVAGMTRGNFLIAYSAATGATSDIYSRTLALPIGPQAYALGGQVALSPPGPFFCLFPDLAVTADRVTAAWYQRPNVGGLRKMMGSIFQKVGTGLTLAGRTDIDMAGENLGFSSTGPKWNRYHWFHAANVAMDAKGNVVAAYDSGAHAKVALVRNTPIYYDSASFLSKSLKVENPAIPAFVFNPASDSVTFLPFRPTTTDSLNTHIRIALSPDNTFSGAGSAYHPLPAAQKAASGFYRYGVDLLTVKTGNPSNTNLTTPKLKALDIEYNVKPFTPGVDSIKPGSRPQSAYNPAGPYPLLTRKDSLKLVCSGFDADDAGLEFRISLGGTLLKAVVGTRVSPGNYTATLDFLPPDTLMNPLILALTTVDQGAWSSRPLILSFGFRNSPPAQTLTVYRNRGWDSASVFRPFGGGVDTISPVNGGLLVIQDGDSLTLKARYADSNDNSVTATWLRNSVILGSRTLPVTDSVAFRFSPDTLAPAIDTAVAKVGDKDTTVTFRIPVRLNHVPSVDSVYHADYKGKDSILKVGPFDKVRNFATDTGLTIPPGLLTTIGGGFSDVDLTAGDSLSVIWRVWKQPPLCAKGNLSCYIKTDSGTGLTLSRVFSIQEQYLTVRVTDAFGAFRERGLFLEYPVLDTSGTAVAVNSLKRDIDFVIGAEKHDTAVKAEILSQGTAPLLILSVATKNNDRKWLDFKLEWITGSPPRLDSARFSGATNVNALAGGKTVSLPPGTALDFDFRFFSDSLRGDSVLTDTLVVLTNDFVNPILKIPFRLEHRDLPLVRLEVLGTPAAGPPGGFNASGLPKLVPARSTLSMVFSETVRVPDPAKMFRVYSYLDSLKNPAGFEIIPGAYEYRLRKAGLGKIAAASDSLADTVVFTPKYIKASDSLKVMPGPGFFIYRDILHIRLSNAITDKSGNGLDLRLDKKVRAPGSFDTVFQARVDTSLFRVVSTQPEAGSNGWNPEGTIKIRFNRKLSKGPPAGTDSLTLLALNALKAGDNRSVHVTSVYRPGKTYDFQFLSLADNDSSLVFRTRPLLPSRDTVSISLSGGILDTSGLSLDGNGDKFPNWLYDKRDTVDSYGFTFITTDADFYVFPNPFRFADSRHRDKGTITFKNLNSLRGYGIGKDVVLRVHTMTGDLVYNSKTSSKQYGPDNLLSTSLDWDLTNDHGSVVGTGVYIYTLMTEGSKLLHKGKVAVVR